MYALAHSKKQMSLDSGATIGSWRIEQQLGRGAMAVVYRARNETLGTTAALKVLERTDPDTEARLLAEGRAQAAIEHPGIVRVRDVLRTQDGRAVLVMEEVEGTDLQALLAEGMLPLDRALDLFRQVLSAVDAAHARELVHRDLKPGNILIDPDTWTAKVGDFGLVKESESQATATRALLGTPRYMAPEQMRSSRRIDARADVFALGCILYELATGRPAFPGDDLVDLYTAKSAGAYADPAVLRPDLPEPVRRAIHGALTGTLSRRIPSCGTLRAVLDGARWPPEDAAGETLDDAALSSWRCPSCGTSTEADLCEACGAATLLCNRFQLVDALASARHTATWRALDLVTGEWVVARGMTRDAPGELLTRFRRGISVLQGIEHPQLPQIGVEPFDEAGRTWEIREYIDGEPLDRWVADHRLDDEGVLDLVLDLVPVLATLHGMSPPIVHRNLVPENVIRAEDGRLVLVDFANVRDALPDPDVGGASFEGPFGAMAPEQYRGDASPASDVYGLGTLAVSLLARKPASALQSTSGLRWEDAVQASDRTRDILRRMLADDPAARPDIREVGRAIAARPALPVPAEPTSIDRRRRGLEMAMIAVGMISLSALCILPVGSRAWHALMATQFGQILAISTSVMFVDVHEPPADLTSPAPAPACDQTPSTVTVTLDARAGDEPHELLFRGACSKVWAPVGFAVPGEPTELALPGAGQLRSAWAPAWSCRREDRPVDGCTIAGGSTVAMELGPKLGETVVPASLRIEDTTGAALPEAVLGRTETTATRTADAAGEVRFPYAFGKSRSLTVAVDGVAVPYERIERDGQLVFVVPAERDVIRGTVAQALAGSEPGELRVGCGTVQDDDRHTYARRALAIPDADGTWACAVPRDGREVHVDLSAGVLPVAELTEADRAKLPERVAELDRPLRRFDVACVGLPDETCTPLEVLSCVDLTRPEPAVPLPNQTPAPFEIPLFVGVCDEVGAPGQVERVQCICPPETDGVLASGFVTRLAPEATSLWIDFRDVPGGMRIRAPVAPEHYDSCRVHAWGGLSSRTVRGVDEHGWMELVGLRAGTWMIEVHCKDYHHTTSVTVDRDRVTVDLPDTP